MAEDYTDELNDLLGSPSGRPGGGAPPATSAPTTPDAGDLDALAKPNADSRDGLWGVRKRDMLPTGAPVREPVLEGDAPGEQPTAEGPAPTEKPPGEDYSAELNDLLGRTPGGDGVQLAALATSAGINPAAAREAMQLAKQTGANPEFVARHLEDYRKEQEGKPWLDAAQAAPALAQWAGKTPLAPAAVQDDLGTLAKLEQAFLHPFDTDWEAIKGASLGVYAGAKGLALGGRDLRDLYGGSPENRQKADALSQEIEELRQHVSSPIGSFAFGNAEQVPMLAADYGLRLLGGRVGSAVGKLAAAGEEVAGGGPEDPAADVAALATMAGSEKVGQTVAGLGFQVALNQGQLYRAMHEVRDANGQPLDPDLQKGMAQVGGALAGGLMTLTGGPMGATGRAAVQKQALQMVTQSLLDKGVTGQLVLGAKRFGVHYLTGATVMAAQSAMNAATVEGAKELSGETYDARASRVLDAAESGFKSALINLPLAAGLSAGADVHEAVGRAMHDQQLQLQNLQLLDAARTSKTVAEAPEQAGDLAKGIAKQPGAVGAAHLDKAQWDRHWQDEVKADPREAWASLVGDGGAGYDQATGEKSGELRMPVEKYIPFLKTDAARALIDDVRLDGQTETARQSKARSAQVRTRMEALAKAPVEALDDGARQVYQDLKSKLEFNGKDDEANLDAVLVHAKQFQAVSESFANDPHREGQAPSAWDLYAPNAPAVVDENGRGLPARQWEEMPVAEGVGVNAPVPTQGDMAHAAQWVDRLRSPERQKAGREFLQYVEDHLAGKETNPGEVMKNLPRDLELELANRYGIADPRGFRDATALRSGYHGGQRTKRDLGASDTGQADKRAEFFGRIGRLNQEDVEHPAIGELREEFKPHLEHPETDVALRRLYEDPVTGLRNERAAALDPADPSRPMVLRFSPEGVKYRNDDLEKGGHHKADELLRATAEQAATIDPRVSRAGGDFELRVRDEAHAKEFLEKLRAAMPEQAKGYGIAGEVAATGKEAGEKLGTVNETAEESGARAKRGERPKGLREGEDAGTAIKGERVKAEISAKHRDALEKELATPEGQERLFRLIHLEPTTKLLTRVGHDVRKAISPQPFRASIDLNGLKRLNKAVSKEFGNRLLEKFGQLAAKRGLDFDFAHDHGDEYLAQGPSREALEGFLRELFDQAAKAEVEGHGERDGVGGTYTYSKLLFGHGVSEAHDERGAERELNEHKQRLSIAGDRGNEDQPPRLEFREGARGPNGDSDGGRGGVDTDHVGEGAGGSLPQDADARDGQVGGSGGEAESRGEGQGSGAETAHEVALPEGGLFRLNSKRGRGFIEFTPPGEGARSFKIHLQKGADASTLTHELSHWFGEVLGDLAQREDAPASVRADYDTLLKFMGYGTHEERIAAGNERRELGRIPADQATPEQRARHKSLTAKEERFAHGWEQYLSEGKAPSVELAPVFARFKRWLTGIYRSAMGRAGVDANFRRTFGEALGLTDEVRSVFDRQLASEDQIAKAHETMGAESFDALRANMTPERQAAYDQTREQARQQDESELTGRIARATAKEDSTFFKEKGDELRPQVEHDVDQVPVNRTLRYFEHGDLPESPGKLPKMLRGEDGKPLKLDRKAFVKEHGVADARRMPKDVWDEAGRGVSPEELAELLDWRSPDEMITALTDATPREEVIHNEVQRRLEERWGARLLDSPKGLADEALGSAHNPARAEVVLHEIRALAHELNPAKADTGLDLAMLRRHAERIVRNLSVADLTGGRQGAAGRFLRAERTAAREAMDAYAAGRKGDALGAKDTQLLNMHLYRAARDARERLELQRRVLQQATRKPWQEALGKADVAAVDGPFRDASNAVLEAVGMRRPDSPAGPDPKALDALVAKVGTDKLGFDPSDLRPLLERPKDWGDLTSDEAETVHDALKSMRHAANDQLELDLAGKQQARGKFFDDLEAAAKSRGAPLPPVAHTKSGETVTDKIRSFVRGADTWLTSISSYVESLDGGDRNGPAHKLFLDEHLDRLVVRANLDRQVLVGVRKAIEALPKALKGRMNERLEGLDKLLPMRPEHADDVGAPSTRADLWTLFLRSGDADNRQRIRDGNGWSDAQVQAALNLLSPEEGRFLQGLLDTIEGLHPELAKVHQQRTGLPMGKVEATPITIGGEKYRGGYFPIVYDPRLSKQGAYQASAVEAELFGHGAGAPRVFSGHTKERAQRVSAPVSLEFGTVQVHLAQAAHDIAMGDWVRKAAGVVLAPRFKSIVGRKLGAERTEQFMPWLRDIAADRAGSMAGAFDATPGAIRAFENFAAKRMTLALVGGNLRSMAMHLSDPLKALMARDSPLSEWPDRAMRIATAWGKTLATFSPGAGVRPEWALSKELTVRDARETENLQKALRELGGPTNPILRGAGSVAHAAEEVSNWARFHLDQFHYRAIWTAGYDEGIAKGMAPAEASRHGDDFVNESLPSNDVADKPSLLRSKRGLSQLAAMLFGYANKMWNTGVHRPIANIADVLRDPRSTGWQKVRSPAELAAKWMIVGTLGAGFKALVGNGPKDDDDEKHRVPWLVRQVLLEQTGTIPLLGSGIESASEGRPIDERTLPGAALIGTSIDRARKLIDHAANGGGGDSDAWDAIDIMVGQGTGFVAQTHRTAGYIKGRKSGDIPAPTGPLAPLKTAWGALVTGAPHKR